MALSPSRALAGTASLALVSVRSFAESHPGLDPHSHPHPHLTFVWLLVLVVIIPSSHTHHVLNYSVLDRNHCRVRGGPTRDHRRRGRPRPQEEEQQEEELQQVGIVLSQRMSLMPHPLLFTSMLLETYSRIEYPFVSSHD